MSEFGVGPLIPILIIDAFSSSAIILLRKMAVYFTLQPIQTAVHTNHYESLFSSCQVMNSPFIFIEGLQS